VQHTATHCITLHHTAVQRSKQRRARSTSLILSSSLMKCVSPMIAIFRRYIWIYWVAVCCSVMQCVAVWCSVMQCDAVWCSVLQCVAVCCSVIQCVAVCCSLLQCVAVCCSVLQCVWWNACRLWSRSFAGMYEYIVSECVAVCCSVLQCGSSL